ncbi:uncharacterized protein EI97DRAFT_51383 [Westerdykella ornata]|uniref:Uncharacterized protein n=1 Tax=Westerdykella ornata TaxID=318751 RepID=A0A6A6JJ69_WESOR|nr:uncharacterized protein EI97DRAFT_51383 [Westerdykella ornata]KAF2276173.1 hypothetical protein EI97DRAFT_51383 [Westerdykella ornata]
MWMYTTIVLLAFFFPPTLFLRNHARYDAETGRFHSLDYHPHPPGRRKKMVDSRCAAATGIDSAGGKGSSAASTNTTTRQGTRNPATIKGRSRKKEDDAAEKSKVLQAARAEVGLEKRAKRVCEMAYEGGEGEERWIEGRRVGTDLLFG